MVVVLACRGALLAVSLVVLLLGCGGMTPSDEPQDSSQQVVVSPNEEGANSMTVRVIDSEHQLDAVAGATAAEVAELTGEASSERISALELASGGRTVLVVWAGLACDQSGSITVIDAGRRIVVAPDAVKDCESLPNYRGVVLTFREPRSADSLRLELRPTEILE